MNDTPIRRVKASVLLLAGTSFLPGAVLAQSDDDSLLDEVVVTAERREASVQEVPIAVSAYGEAAIEKLQIDETLDLVNVVPNLFGANNTGLGTANMYYLRAQGNDESIATFDPPVGTYVDDVYITRQNANNFSFYDVERIEVLRGPQGTLFGRNTTGGAINVILKKPAETMGGYLEVGWGRYEETLFRGSMDVPLSDTVLTKFSGYVNESEGWLDNFTDGMHYNGKSNYGVRFATRIIAAENATWDLSFDRSKSDEASVLGDPRGDHRVSFSILGGGLPSGLGPQKAPEYGNEVVATNVTSNMTWGLDDGSVSFIVGSRDIKQKFLLNFPGLGSDDFFWIDNVGDHEMISVELKWDQTLADGRVNLVSGLYFMDEDNITDFADYLFGALTLADRVLTNKTRSMSVYAQADFMVGDNGTFTLGARYTDEEKDIGVSDNTGGNLTSAEMQAAGIPLSQNEKRTTPRIAYRHQMSDDLMWYVSATNGFKSGGWNARSSNAALLQPFGPEEIWSYEVGMRADWNDRFRTNATLFYTDLEDLQTTSATPSGAFLTTNAGGLEVTGLELELTAAPTDNWEVFLALGLQDAKYVDLPGGCTVPNTDFAAFDINCNIADPKRSPESTATLSTSYDIPLSGMGATLRPTISARYIGENVVGTRQSGENDAETVINAEIGLYDDENRWSATLECKNCSDERYITSFLFGPYWTEPRTYMLRFRMNFTGR